MSHKNLKISIIGLGYVGLPLAISFAKHFHVTGFDKSAERIKELNSGCDSTLMIDENKITNSKNIKFTNNENNLSDSNVYIVTVPTPIDKNNNPDLTFIINATKTVKNVIKKNDIFVLESTVFPGTTEEVCVPILEESGLVFNKDFFCGYSPERINPGDTERSLKDIKKIVSGSDKKTSKILFEMYSKIIQAGIHQTDSIKIAEAAKVIENTQRDINIALANELAKIFDLMEIDTQKVIDAAATKWNYSNYRPGLVGGHCIGVDPYYLTYKAQEIGYHPEMILAGRRINDGMHEFVVEKIQKEIIQRKISLKNLNILVLGMAFKENCNDTRNSKSFDLIRSLRKLDLDIFHSEPYINDLSVDDSTNINFDKLADYDKNFDVIIISVPHESFVNNIDKIKSKLKNKDSFIFDVKGSMKNFGFYSL